MEIITITNQKGGVGKSTTTYNLGYNLNTLHKKRVLLIDLDAQSNMSFIAGVNLLDVPCSMYDVFKNKRDINDSIINLKKGLDIIVGSIDLASADRDFLNLGREKLLGKALKELKSEYDFVIIDTPPTLGVMCENALACSNKVIIPMSASIFSLQGVSQLYGFINEIREEVNGGLEIDGILITKVDERTNVYNEIKDHFEQVAEQMETKVYKTIIRQTIKVEESAMQRASLIDSRPDATATKDYIEFTKEFLKRK